MAAVNIHGNTHTPARGRKLTTQTCADTFARQLLARRHPGLCEELAAAVAGGDCGEAGVWSGRGLGGNRTRVKMVEDNILRWVHWAANPAQILFIKYPILKVFQIHAGKYCFRKVY